MKTTFVTDITNQILATIDAGYSRFVFWGFNSNAIEVLSELNRLGIMSSYVFGVVDPAPNMQGKRVFHFEVIGAHAIINLDFDVLVITENDGKEDCLRQFQDTDSRIPKVIMSGVDHLAFKDEQFSNLISSCLVKSYATGYTNSLIHIYQSIKYLAESGIQGSVAEFGIFKGGTIVFISKVLKHFGFNTKIYGFDIFEGFPSGRTIFDLYSNPKCEFNDYEAVSRYCINYGIEVVKGDIVETYRVLQNEALMLSFFDTDNYSPVKAALEMCFQQTVKGGVLAFDHFTTDEQFIYTIGERIAAKEILANKKLLNLHETGIFIKI